MVASLLLFDDIWVEFRESVDGDLIAAAPSRDVVMFTGSSSVDGIRAMRETVNRITDTGAYLVSSSMLRRVPGGWTVFS